MAADAQEAETSKYEMLETDKSDMEAEYEEKIGQMEERNQQVTPARPSDDRLDCSRKDSSIQQNSISHFVCPVLCAPRQRIGPAESLLGGKNRCTADPRVPRAAVPAEDLHRTGAARPGMLCLCQRYAAFVPAVC